MYDNGEDKTKWHERLWRFFFTSASKESRTDEATVRVREGRAEYERQSTRGARVVPQSWSLHPESLVDGKDIILCLSITFPCMTTF